MAEGWLKQLHKENPEYSKIVMETLDEDEKPEIQEKYEYELVPNFWIKDKKVLEGIPSKKLLRAVLDEALRIKQSGEGEPAEDLNNIEKESKPSC